MKLERVLVLVLALALAFTLGVQLSRAQVSTPEGAQQSAVESRLAAAAMNDAIPIQGRLTDAGGRPLNGNYSITASIYDVSTGGSARCSDTESVTVTNGLFYMDVNHCTPANINGDQLYLGIKVDTEPEMTPRRALNGVPYAWTLRPGSVVKGANSFLFVPGSAAVKLNSLDATVLNEQGGVVYIGSGAGALTSAYVVVPIAIPSVLYGQPTRVTDVTVYYSTFNSSSSIVGTELINTLVDGGWSHIATDTAVHDSTTWTNYTFATDPSMNVLSADSGSLALLIHMELAPGYPIRLGSVRLTLSHNY